MVAPTAETDNSRQNKKSRTLEDIAFLECAGFSFESGTSAFHGSCRTSTAKLRSRVCPRGESCMRSFDLLRLYMICISYALRRLARFRAREGKSDPPSVLSALLSYRAVHEGVRRELWAPGKIFLSEKYHRRNSRFYTVSFS